MILIHYYLKFIKYFLIITIIMNLNIIMIIILTINIIIDMKVHFDFKFVITIIMKDRFY